MYIVVCGLFDLFICLYICLFVYIFCLFVYIFCLFVYIFCLFVYIYFVWLFIYFVWLFIYFVWLFIYFVWLFIYFVWLFIYLFGCLYICLVVYIFGLVWFGSLRIRFFFFAGQFPHSWEDFGKFQKTDVLKQVFPYFIKLNFVTYLLQIIILEQTENIENNIHNISHFIWVHIFVF